MRVSSYYVVHPTNSVSISSLSEDKAFIYTIDHFKILKDQILCYKLEISLKNCIKRDFHILLENSYKFISQNSHNQHLCSWNLSLHPPPMNWFSQ